jgi:hypothetical protein
LRLTDSLVMAAPVVVYDLIHEDIAVGVIEVQVALLPTEGTNVAA